MNIGSAILKENMYFRTIRKNGNSSVIFLPVELSRDKKFYPGDNIIIKPDIKGRLIIEKITPENFPKLYEQPNQKE